MENPWGKLIEEIKEEGFNGNYVLKEEQAILEKFNEKLKNFSNKDKEFSIHTEIMPAPFMGDVHNAPIVILMLNPSYDSMEDERGYYKNYRSYWKDEIVHIPSIHDYPFFALDIEYCKFSPYWENKLKFLLEHTDRATLAKKICTIQLFPYHSKNYKPIYKKLIKEENFDKYLPSQKYNFELVKNAMARNAIIIIARGKKEWYEAIPALAILDGSEKYENQHFTRSSQNITISRNNLPDVFDEIIKKIK